MSLVSEKVVKGQHLAPDPAVEAPESEGDSGQARERESRRTGLLLVIVGVVFMALAATEAVAAEDGAPGPAEKAAETRLESTD